MRRDCHGVLGTIVDRRRSSAFVSWLCVTLFCLSCLGLNSCVTPQGKLKREYKHKSDLSDPDAVRYRLLLRENPVDKSGAFVCYGHCQEQTSPDAYLECLQQCPGFDVVHGVKCASYEVPPVAACFTARKVPREDELDPALVVLAVVANYAIVIAASTVCLSMGSCTYPYTTPPVR